MCKSFLRNLAFELQSTLIISFTGFIISLFRIFPTFRWTKTNSFTFWGTTQRLGEWPLFKGKFALARVIKPNYRHSGETCNRSGCRKEPRITRNSRGDRPESTIPVSLCTSGPPGKEECCWGMSINVELPMELKVILSML